MLDKRVFNSGKSEIKTTYNMINGTVPTDLVTVSTAETVGTDKRLKIESTETTGTREALIGTVDFELSSFKAVYVSFNGFTCGTSTIPVYFKLKKTGEDTEIAMMNDEFRIRSTGSYKLQEADMQYNVNGENGAKRKNLGMLFDTVTEYVYIMEDDQLLLKRYCGGRGINYTGDWSFTLNIWDSSKSVDTWLELSSIDLVLFE